MHKILHITVVKGPLFVIFVQLLFLFWSASLYCQSILNKAIYSIDELNVMTEVAFKAGGNQQP